jgi:uncharacterized protein (TIGR03084 family)
MAETGALREEGELLLGIVEPAGAALRGVGPFAGWTGEDTLAVLAFVDRMAYLVLANRAAYEWELAAFGEATAAGGGPGELHGRMGAFACSRYDASGWWQGFVATCGELDGHDGDEPVPWFGRNLTVDRLVAARQMETFAYGQDIADLVRARRPATDRLWPVADFGVRTLRFSFANRGLPVPEAQPRVELLAPSGARWSWGDPAAHDRVEGPAEDFCLVTTQRRHVEDTGLRVTGAVATEWLTIAQSIAGPPLPGPAAGARVWA